MAEIIQFPSPARVDPVPNQGAMNRHQAARYLGTSTTRLWRLCNLPESDPRRIRKTSYGTYAKAELDRHLAAEISDDAA